MKFRKKLVIVEATQWWKLGDHPAVKRHYTHEHWWPKVSIGNGWINTLEGGHIVAPGDWIITSATGKHYPCKPDIFEATYEPISGMSAHNAMAREARSRLLAENETLKVDRDELLKALKVAKWMLERDYIDDPKMQVIKRCDATIAKMEGRA